MNDISSNKWSSMTDQAVMAEIGEFVKKKRLELNKTQERVADESGISRSTLSLLERGETVTLATFISVLRSINCLHVLNAFTIPDIPSPLELMKRSKKSKKRARPKKDALPPEQYNSDW